MTQVNFTASGSFTVPAGVTTIDVLLVAGGGPSGGAGGGTGPGGGGGAGGVRWLTGVDVTPGEVIPVTVGAGGVPHASGGTGTNGGDTSIAPLSGTLTAVGGGAGGHYFGTAGVVGGSGGGGSSNGSGGTPAGANGTPGQGNKGGNGNVSGTASSRASGAGGGAGGVGGNGTTGTAGNGGVGVDMSAHVGTGVGAAGWFGGGGGGATGGVAGGTAGQGGGGTGKGTGTATAGANGTGGGGGGVNGAAPVVGMAGGSGFVAIVYTEPPPPDPGPHVWVYPNEAAVEAGAPVEDFSCYVDEVSVVHGRSDTTSQPDASTATVEFTVGEEVPAEVWDTVDIGAYLRVVYVTEAVDVVDRFLGRVTDLTLAWDDAGTETPNAGIGQLVAAGQLSDLGRLTVGAAGYPQQLDGARVVDVLDEAGVTYDPGNIDPGTVEVLAREADPVTALAAIHETAESARGMLWQTRAGAVAYADSDHRRGALVEVTLDACDLLVTPVWRRDLSGLVNTVTVSYGDPEGHYEAEDAGSVAARGVYARTYKTELADEVDASAMGNLVLLQNSTPVWVLSAIPVDTKGLAEAAYLDLLHLDVGSLLMLTGLPAIGHAPTTLAAWVEGWRERWTFGAHDVELVVSDYCRTAAPVEWDEVDVDLTWDSYGDGTWDEASCGGYSPLPDLGRWNDVPASLRWDQVDDTTTWDTWT